MGIETQGTITAIGTSRNGKPTVTIDGKLYYLGTTKLNGVTVGDRISFEATAFGSRGDLWSIDRYARITGSAHAETPIRPAPIVSDEAVLRFVSNCVGSAIASGTLKDPTEIEKWFAAARNAWHNQMSGE